MKKYVLYPGVGRVLPTDAKPRYVTGRQLAACYRVPYSDCLDTDNAAIKKVMSMSKAPLTLISLVPKQDGIYRLPDLRQSKILNEHGVPFEVNKNG